MEYLQSTSWIALGDCLLVLPIVVLLCILVLQNKYEDRILLMDVIPYDVDLSLYFTRIIPSERKLFLMKSRTICQPVPINYID